MTNPKKLIRDKIIFKLKNDEWCEIQDKAELNRLYSLKVLEELDEVKNSHFNDPSEFADLFHAVVQFAAINEISVQDMININFDKFETRGALWKTVLTNLNPNNPSNRIYFEDQGKA